MLLFLLYFMLFDKIVVLSHKFIVVKKNNFCICNVIHINIVFKFLKNKKLISYHETT